MMRHRMIVPVARCTAGRRASFGCSRGRMVVYVPSRWSCSSSFRCCISSCRRTARSICRTTAVTLIGKIMCYAIVALAMDLIWGYTGILSLGHGLFFALGGYAMGMYLMRSIGHDGVIPERPAGLHGVPRLEGTIPGTGASPTTSGMRRCWWCWCPGCSRFVFGFFAFRSRIKGVYFSIITQALTYAFMLLFFRNDTGFGGNNGFTDFKRILGLSDHRAGDAHGAVRAHRRRAARAFCCSAAGSSRPSSAAC